MSDKVNGSPKDQSWFERPANVRRILWAFYAACALVFVIDPLVHKHGKFEIEHWFGFYAIYGFIACVALVLISKELRRLLMQREDYYDE